jgi:hypothetical protein
LPYTQSQGHQQHHQQQHQQQQQQSFNEYQYGPPY